MNDNRQLSHSFWGMGRCNVISPISYVKLSIWTWNCYMSSSGDVRVNWTPITKNGTILKTGDIVSVSGKGRLKVRFSIQSKRKLVALSSYLFILSISDFWLFSSYSDWRNKFYKKGKICYWAYQVCVSSGDIGISLGGEHQDCSLRNNESKSLFNMTFIQLYMLKSEHSFIR